MLEINGRRQFTRNKSKDTGEKREKHIQKTMLKASESEENGYICTPSAGLRETKKDEQGRIYVNGQQEMYCYGVKANDRGIG